MADQPFSGSLKPGTKLGKYEVGEQIATGGMAVIYKAYDPSLDRSVAIKQIAPHLAQDERFLDRFRTEAQTLAKLSSSQANIVNVHELIQQDGQLYLVMEYVEGTTLRALMDRGPVPLQTGLGVLLSTALGLRAMHKSQIVHRDLTPANVMMAKDGALKITDFGLIGHSGGKTSLPMGTTKYMAPEMFTGAPVDGRADVYSLGFIAYEMFAGPEKFQEVFRDVLRDERAQQVRWMHWHSNPAQTGPSLKELQPGIPPLVSKIVERMMEKDPSKRFASADQIIKWLRRIFVMHVKGSSLTQTDSESIEQEMEADANAGASGPPARRPTVRPEAAGAGQALQAAGGGAAVAAAAEAGLPETSAERTAPLPEQKWTWKRAAFWGGVVGGPLIAIAVGLLIWNGHVTALREKDAKQDWVKAIQAWEDKDYQSAMHAFKAIAIEFQDLPGRASEATKYAWMARAEHYLKAEDWDTAAEGATTAEEQYLAPARWAEGFWQRFNKSKEIKQVMKDVDEASKTGNYEQAIGLLTNLQNKYPELELGDQIAKYREKKDLREYTALLEKAREYLTKKNYNEAQVAAEKAQKIRPGPEVKELLATIKSQKQYDQVVLLAKQAEAGKNWSEAAALWQKILDIRPSETIRKKFHYAQAEAIAEVARKLEKNNLVQQAVQKWTEVIEHNPEHPDALAALKRAGRQQQLDEHVKNAKKSMKEGEWEQAINSYQQALKLIDPAKEANLKTQFEEQINLAKYHMAMARAQEALERKDFDEAERLATEAQSYQDTADATSLLERIETRRQYHGHLDVGKELLSQLSYSQALDAFQRAQQVMDTQEVRDLIAETKHCWNLARGKSYLQDKRFKEALAWLHLAQKAKNTEYVKGLIDLVRRAMASQPQEKPEE